MMSTSVLLLLLSLSAALAAPSAQYGDYTVVMPQKRAALVLDRLLVALQKALHDDGASVDQSRYDRPDRDGPRTSPLRIAPLDYSDTMLNSLSREGPLRLRNLDVAPSFANIEEDNDMNALQRRAGGESRGRVVKCYFNAITCF